MNEKWQLFLSKEKNQISKCGVKRITSTMPKTTQPSRPSLPNQPQPSPPHYPHPTPPRFSPPSTLTPPPPQKKSKVICKFQLDSWILPPKHPTATSVPDPITHQHPPPPTPSPLPALIFYPPYPHKHKFKDKQTTTTKQFHPSFYPAFLLFFNILKSDILFSSQF